MKDLFVEKLRQFKVVEDEVTIMVQEVLPDTLGVVLDSTMVESIKSEVHLEDSNH
jgi:hypothetical protein